MKVKFVNDKLFVYLYNEIVNIDDIDELNERIKKIFIKLIKKYQLDFYGLNKVTVYHNNKYGMVLEIEKIYSSVYEHSVIDLKIIIYKNVKMYLEFDDYCFLEKPKNLIIKNNKYYLSVDSITNINKYIEFGKIIFDCNKIKV